MIREGILLGITLSFVIGPLFFSIIQASLEKGFRAGVAVAAGMWASDALYIAAVVLALQRLIALADLPNFRFYSGLGGGIILIVFGLVSVFSEKNKMLASAQDISIEQAQASTFKQNTQYFMKGFLINAINPGTIFFWMGISTAYIFPNNLNPTQIVVFFTAMMLTLILTDTLKAYSAKRLRNWMTPAHIAWTQMGIGALLVVFGAVLVIQAF